jgi:hypothetical protein
MPFKLFLAIAMISMSALSDEIKFDIGIGYRLQSTEIYGSDFDHWRDHKAQTAYAAIVWHNDNCGCQIELAHDSNWLTGFPSNSGRELHQTSIRIVKSFSLWRF